MKRLALWSVAALAFVASIAEIAEARLAPSRLYPSVAAFFSNDGTNLLPSTGIDMVGNKLCLDSDGDCTAYFQSDADDIIKLYLNGTQRWYIGHSGLLLGSISGTGPRMLIATSSLTVPTLVPYANDPDSGLGCDGSGSCAVIVDGSNPATFTASSIDLGATSDVLCFDSDNNSCISAVTNNWLSFQPGDVQVMVMKNTEVDFYMPLVLDNNTAAAPSEPYACNANNTGAIQYVDDNDDGAIAQICVCMDLDDGSTFDWRKLDDTATACGFF